MSLILSYAIIQNQQKAWGDNNGASNDFITSIIGVTKNAIDKIWTNLAINQSALILVNSDIGDKNNITKSLEYPKAPVLTGKDYNVTITEKDRSGKGIARIDGMVIFVKDGKVGQNALVHIIEVGHRYAIAEVINVISVTPNTTGSKTSATSGFSNRTPNIEDKHTEKPFFGTFNLWLDLSLLLVSISIAIISFIKKVLPKKLTKHLHKMNMDIRLEKYEYIAGETVKGILSVYIDKPFNAKQFKFLAYGKEIATIRQLPRGSYAYRTYQSVDIFFSKDLSQFLGSLETEVLSNGTLQVSEQVKEIPFHFAVPENALESYNGKNVLIKYIIKATANIRRTLDFNKEISFTVILNPNAAHMNDKWTIMADEKREGVATTRLEIEESKNSFPPRGSIRGKLIVENHRDKKIRKAEITLNAVEHASASSLGILSRHVSKKITKRFSSTEKTIIIEKYVEMINWREGCSSVSFDIQIPKDAKRSYNGTYSAYYWILEAKLDIKWSRDLYAKAYYGKPDLSQLKRGKIFGSLIWMDDRLTLLTFAVKA